MLSTDAKMAFRNIWRNPTRTILTISAIAFAALLLVFVLSFQFGSYEAMINASVKIHTGHLQIQAEGYHEDQEIRDVIADPGPVGKLLSENPFVRHYTFRANGFALVSSENRSRGVLVVGIEPEREAAVSTLASLIRKGDFLTPGDTDRALVGSLLARHLKVAPGDELTILGQARDGSVAAAIVTVKGIYSSGMDEFDRSSIQIPLSYFQEVFAMRGGIHQAVGICETLSDVKRAKTILTPAVRRRDNRKPLICLDWKELMPGLVQTIKLDLSSSAIFYLILNIVVAFSILNTFLMAVMERTKEFGVMLSMGTGPGRLFKILLLESVALTLIGVALGCIGGCLVTLWFQEHGIDISALSANATDMLAAYGISGKIYPRLSVVSALTWPAIIVVLSLLAALYPALKVRKLRPVEALAHM